MSGLAAEPEAASIRRDTGVNAGLAVLVAPDPGLANDLAADGRLLVHAIYPEAAAAARARTASFTALRHGQVTADHLDSLARLPYPDHLVALLVADLDASGLKRDEAMRVLAPEGCAWLRQGGTWSAMRKPLPPTMDGWPHWDYDAGGNPINHDRALELSDSLRWMGGPHKLPGHGADLGWRIDGGLAVCAERGVIEETKGVSRGHYLVCRGAHDGIQRWRLPLSNDTGIPNRHAVILGGGRLYTHLKAGEPMVAIDAATGTVVVTFDQGAKVQPEAKLPYGQSPRTHPSYHLVARLVDKRLLQADGTALYCLDAATGKLLWKRATAGTNLNWVVAGDGLAIVAESAKPIEPFRGSFAFWLDRIVAVDLASGAERWTTAALAGGAAFRLVLHEGTLYVPRFAALAVDAKGYKAGELNHGYGQEYLVHAFDARTGALRWKSDSPRKASAHYQVAMVQGERVHVVGQSGFALSTKDGSFLFNYDFSPFDGCGDPRGTPRWMFYTMSFLQCSDQRELISAGTKGRPSHVRVNNRGMARSTCDTGVFPAYGNVYTSPSMCGCNDYLAGYNAFTAQPMPTAVPDDRRLSPGPAAGAGSKPGTWPIAGEWPIFLGNPARTAAVAGAGPEKLRQLWHTPPLARFPDGPLGEDWSQDERSEGPVTPPTAGGGMVLVAVRHQQRLIGLDAATGAERWSHLSAGGIDSPPTLYGGLCLFGSRDGRITALRLSDGAVAWSFLAAPADRRLIDGSHLESSWPVSGSVLVQNDALYAVAGRHSSLDGGLVVLKLDPLSGRLLARAHVDTNPAKMEATNRTNYGGNRRGMDLLVGSGRFVHHRRETIDPDLKEAEIRTEGPAQTPSDRPFLFARQYFLGCRRASLGRYFTPELAWLASDPKPQIQAYFIAVVGDRLVAAMPGGQSKLASHALDGDGRATAEAAWTQPLTSRVDALAIAGGRIYLATSKPELAVHDLASGAPGARLALPARVHKNGLALAGGRALATLVDGSVVAVGE